MAAETRPTGGRTPGSGARIARNTAIFSVLTGLSRIAGLIREVVASSFFGTSGAFSAFTLAFQVPNLIRSLFADAALSAAFVPVFTELLEQGRRRDAYQLASTFVFLIVAALTAICAFFVLLAPWIMPLLTGSEFTAELDDLTVGLSQVLFPIVLLLGLNGLVVGILNAYDHFTIPALAPLVWNVVIIAVLVALQPLFDGPDELYAYAIGVLAGTLVQLLMALPVLRRLDFALPFKVDLRDPRVGRVLALMLPVTLSLGLINFNLVINSVLGSWVSEAAPRAIDAAFRVYMLPQGMFSVAIATVLFPALARLATRRDTEGLRAMTATGTRQIFLLLIPAAACTLVLAEPITRLVYERGEFGPDSTEVVAEALFWFSFSLPFAGANLLLTRTFFSLQRPWLPTALGALTLVINIAVALALYRPFGVAGIVIGTAVASAAMTAGQAYYLRRELGGRLEAGATVSAVARMLVAALALAAVAYVVWRALDEALGRSLPAQVVSVGTGLGAGLIAYAAAVLALRVPEAAQIRDLVRARRRR
ncbi:MAG TPA: murein biosynthesis integral membrane protein MurJ [Solirubrobacteraceae bacterium]|jgi:putative peptidoglycan lipid II flippase|nr:murein biosynthesis integral membrane protein MurJ [Solirubrobacteraceae bacterium]